MTFSHRRFEGGFVWKSRVHDVDITASDAQNEMPQLRLILISNPARLSDRPCMSASLAFGSSNPGSAAASSGDPGSIGLSLAKRGACQVVGFALPAEQEQRLRAMGFYEGQRVEVLRQGRTVMVKVAGSRLALAQEIAQHVLVEPCR